MIKAFLFDYDGVITAGVGDGIPAARLARNLHISPEQAAGFIGGIWDGFSTGRLSSQEAWHIIEQQYGRPINTDERDIWYSWSELQPLPDMLELIDSLKAKGYVVGVVSNVLPVTAELIRQHNGYSGFDFVILSCEVGARKPKPLVYEAALAKLPGIHPSEVAYLDDREHLTQAADQLGFKTIHVIDQAQAISDVYRLIA